MRQRGCGSSRVWVAGCLVAVAAAGRGAAGAPLVTPVNQRVDVELHGDDPSVVIPVELVPNLAAPLLVRVDAYFENLAAVETNVRYDVYWLAPGGGAYEGFLGPDFGRLPPPAELATVSVHFEQTIPFTPGTVFLLIEGGGPDDHVHFLGEFELVTVPEPAAAGVPVLAAALGLLGRGRRGGLT
jgi:hypothetical protein